MSLYSNDGDVKSTILSANNVTLRIGGDETNFVGRGWVKTFTYVDNLGRTRIKQELLSAKISEELVNYYTGVEPEPEPEPEVYLPNVSFAPLGVWSLDKHVEDYNGNIAVGTSVGASNTPASTQNIGFIGDDGPDLTAAQTAYGNIISIYQLNDQSGNGHHATQPVATKRPTINLANNLNGKVGITFANPTTGAASDPHLIFPDSLTTNRTDLTVFVVASAGGGLINGTCMMGLGKGTGSFDGFNLNHSNNSSPNQDWFGGVGIVDSAFAGEFARQPTVGQYCVISTQSRTTERRVVVAGTAHTKTTNLPTTATLTGGYYGRGPWSTAYFNVGEVAAVLVYPRLSDADVATITEYLENRYDTLNANDYTDQVIGVGDSIMAGTDAWHRNFMFQINQSGELIRRVDTRNYGIGGKQIAGATGMYVQRAYYGKIYKSALTTNIFWIHGFTNDIAAMVSGSIVGQSATLWASHFLPLIQYFIGLGGKSKVVVDTVIPRLWAGTTTDREQRETERLAINTLIRDNAATYGYIVNDLAAITEFGPQAGQTAVGTPIQTLYQADNIHLLATGYEACKTRSVSAINQALGA